MRDVLPAIDRWIADGRRFALAIVAETWGSSPRPRGSLLAICETGEVSGSVSGGCVESAVIEKALGLIAEGSVGHVRLTFDQISDEEIWKVGLSCGGSISVVIVPGWTSLEGPTRDAWEAAARAAMNGEPFDLVLENGLAWFRNSQRSLGQAVLDRSGEVDRFVLRDSGRPNLAIVGASHIAIPLIAMAGELGFRTTLIDPRPNLVRQSRFTKAPDRVICGQSEESLDTLPLGEDDALATLSHDPKLDDPALSWGLRRGVGYVGALGSRTTHAQRRARLIGSGFSEEQVDRIRGPIGLAIGASTPAEIALSILGQVVEWRNKRPRICAIVLAAGLSRRSAPENKLLRTVGGSSVIDSTVREVCAAFEQVLVVTGHMRPEIEREVAGAPVELIYNPRFADGVGASIAAGVAATDPKATHFVVIPGDMPYLTCADFGSLRSAVLDEPDSIVNAGTEVRPSPPTVFPARHRDALMGLSSDQGARELLAREDVVYLDWPEDALRDLD